MSGKRKPEEGTDGREEGAKRKLDTSPGSSPDETSAVPSTPTPTPIPDISAFPSTAFPLPATGESTVRPIHEGSESMASRPIRFREWNPGSSSLPNQQGSASPAVGNMYFRGPPPFPEIGEQTVRMPYQDSSIATAGSSSHPVPDCWSPIREESASSTSFEFVRSARDPRLPTPPRPIGAPAYLPDPMPGDRRLQKYAVYRRGRFVVTQPLPDTFEPGQELPPLFNRPIRFFSFPNSPVQNELTITGDSSDQRNRPPNENSRGSDLCDRLRNVRIDDVEHQAYLILQEARGMLSYIENQLLPIQILQSKMQPLLNQISESSRALTQILSQRNVAASSSSSSSHTGDPSPFFRQTVDGLEDMIQWLVRWINGMMVATPPNVITFVDSSKPDLTSNILHLLVYLSNKAKNVRKSVEALKKEYPGPDK